MKKLVLILLGIFPVLAQAQNTNCEGDTVVLYLPQGARGTVQWQQSTNLTNYTAIAGATSDSILIVLPAGTSGYRAEIIEGTCNPIFSDVETFTSANKPSPAMAGANQTVNGTSTSLNATAPMVGTGTWSIISGAGGIIATPTNPQSLFTGLVGNTYQLLWTVSVGASCPDNVDTVTIQFLAAPALPTITCNSAPLYIHPTDNSGPMGWGCVGVVSGATDDNNGQLNTSTIVLACTAPTAAHVCANLNAFGYTDWFLPSYNELECVRQNAATIGGFQAGAYWASTEGTAPTFSANARYRTFPSGVSGYGSKNNQNRVRCVRK